MSINIVVPQLGESVVEARVARWIKKVGDAVAAGDALVELETEKVDLEVSAEQAKAIESQRAQLTEELAGARAVRDRTLQDLRAQDREATDRLARLDSRVAQRVAQARAQRERLEARIRSVQRVLADEAVVARAGRRLPLAPSLPAFLERLETLPQ